MMLVGGPVDQLLREPLQRLSESMLPTAGMLSA